MFEEFARKVAPAIHLAGGVNVHIDPAITSEFANVVYRFGHSMLDENVRSYQLGADGKPVIGADGPAGDDRGWPDPGLHQPAAVRRPAVPTRRPTSCWAPSTRSATEIDEFVTGSLRNNLLGLPLDLAALNIARGRDTGVAPLNLVRNQLFSQTGEASLKPYTSWDDFGQSSSTPNR